jgi:hypothetical protein
VRKLCSKKNFCDALIINESGHVEMDLLDEDLGRMDKTT